MIERNNKGQFMKGVRSHTETEFKPGQHWRVEKPYWNREWLNCEYSENERSASDIANEFGVSENAILFWLNKLEIPRRDMMTIRKNKKWGSCGKQNGMYGRYGKENPNWKGGCTPERQSIYSSPEWEIVVKETYKRDNFCCQRCNGTHKKNVPLHVHHIIPFNVKKTRMLLSNLIILCKKCHNFVHSKKNVEGEFIGYL
jgi:hypothetical protein